MFRQNAVTFVHQQAEMLEEKLATIDKQSALIRQLQEETAVSFLFCRFLIVDNRNKEHSLQV